MNDVKAEALIDTRMANNRLVFVASHVSHATYRPFGTLVPERTQRMISFSLTPF